MASSGITKSWEAPAVDNRASHVDMVPGTKIMMDDGRQRSQHAHSHGNKDVVLIPQPSADPLDPLNWTRKRKLVIIVIVSMMSALAGFVLNPGPLSFAPMFPELTKAFDISIATAIGLVGICILVLGFGNFIWVPISTNFGRRIVLITSTLLCVVANIWRASSTSYHSFLGSTILNGIAAAPSEAFQPVVIADIFFLHERGFYMTMYTTVYIIAGMIGPIVSGAMTTNVGWRSFWWLNVALQGFVCILLILFFPETSFNRTSSPNSAQEARPSGVAQPKAMELHYVENAFENNLQHVTTRDLNPYLNKGAPGKRQFPYLCFPRYSKQPLVISLARDIILPLKLFFFYPIVQWSSFVYLGSSANFIMLNLTQSDIFGVPPYNFSSQKVGFTNFATGIGSIIGFATAGPLSDWAALQLTKRNGGIREPEMRLVTLIPYTIISFIGSLIVALGYQRHWSWQPIVVVGYTLVGVQVAAIPGIVITYAIDCYKPATAEFMLATTIYKNVYGYGVSQFLLPFAAKTGFIGPIMMNVCMMIFFILLGIPIYFKGGKALRRLSKNSEVHTML